MNSLSVLFYGVNSPVLNQSYILDGIFGDYSVIQSNFIGLNQEIVATKFYDVLVYNCSDSNRESYFGYPPSYAHIKQVIIKTRPKVIINLADEWDIEHNEIHNLLANYCTLLFRQFRHGTQIGSYPENLYSIPLGCLNGYTTDTSIIKPVGDRKYAWSWVGNLKGDRVEMLIKFWSIWNNIVSTNANLSQEDIYGMYSDSVFVPCGRGNSSLDCWRLYETTVAGAIPVVVGSDEEIDWTFRFFEKIPPWIYANSWDEAVRKTQEVRFNIEKLQQMQTDNIEWWHDMIRTMRTKVSEALANDRVDISQLDIEARELEMAKPISVVTYW